ncbi:MAG TPA: peroxiredoxin [Polyangiaceae bacterium]|nr:peroxiredoxin [Polyangiaceae bacterium]
MAAKKQAKKTAPARTAAPGRARGAAATGAARSPAPRAARPSARSPAGAAAAPAPAAGERAPRFELVEPGGARVGSATLAGQPYVLYFYPRDHTSGCTREAQGFRDAAREFAALGLRVIGVSPDSPASHARFRDQHDLGFTLLSDPDRAVARAFGAFGPKRSRGRETMGIIRSTFLVDGAGKIRRAWRGVRVDGHVAEVLAAAREL